MVDGKPRLLALAIFYGVNILLVKFYSTNVKHKRTTRSLFLPV